MSIRSFAPLAPRAREEAVSVRVLAKTTAETCTSKAGGLSAQCRRLV